MSENSIIVQRPLPPLPPCVPLPACPVTVRLGVLADLPFLDGLQKKHSRQLGFFPRAQLEGYIRNGWVLIAENAPSGEPLGYCASRNRYLKRDELGAIFQLCVADGAQRKFVGATLLKAVFERAPYGCKLFCCWCAHDIAANKFWEAMGFVPLAFRAGSAKKSRVHIFWQRRIRAGNVTTPWWFPSQTSSGAIREDRLVLPIPPGMHWSDAVPVVLPGEEVGSGQLAVGGEEGQAVGSRQLAVGRREKKLRPRSLPATSNPQPATASVIQSGGLRFAAPETEPAKAAKPKRQRKPAAKNDPRHVAFARELRDRWLEQVNQEGLALPAAKYEVSRQLPQYRPLDGPGTAAAA